MDILPLVIEVEILSEVDPVVSVLTTWHESVTVTPLLFRPPEMSAKTPSSVL
jgi:hypothetical protein